MNREGHIRVNFEGYETSLNLGRVSHTCFFRACEAPETTAPRSPTPPDRRDEVWRLREATHLSDSFPLGAMSRTFSAAQYDRNVMFRSVRVVFLTCVLFVPWTFFRAVGEEPLQLGGPHGGDQVPADAAAQGRPPDPHRVQVTDDERLRRSLHVASITDQVHRRR